MTVSFHKSCTWRAVSGMLTLEEELYKGFPFQYLLAKVLPRMVVILIVKKQGRLFLSVRFLNIGLPKGTQNKSSLQPSNLNLIYKDNFKMTILRFPKNLGNFHCSQLQQCCRVAL
jgi:hypothetical protein